MDGHAFHFNPTRTWGTWEVAKQHRSQTDRATQSGGPYITSCCEAGHVCVVWYVLRVADPLWLGLVLPVARSTHRSMPCCPPALLVAKLLLHLFVWSRPRSAGVACALYGTRDNLWQSSFRAVQFYQMTVVAEMEKKDGVLPYFFSISSAAVLSKAFSKGSAVTGPRPLPPIRGLTYHQSQS